MLVVLPSRHRLLAHLSDSRRRRCWEAIVADPASYPPLGADTVRVLDDADREARREAWRSGRTHALATRPATRADGSDVGRVSS